MSSPIDFEQLEAVGQQADARDEELSALRELPADLARTLTRSGICRALAPADLGAPEATVSDFVDGLERLAFHHGSLAWCAMIAGSSSLLSGSIAEPWRTTVYGPAHSITGGHAAPLGTARAVDGGLLVSGSWQWGSGLANATWVGGGCRIVDEAGKPSSLPDGTRAPFVLFEPDQVSRADNWFVSGLESTGSADYAVDEAFVPTGRWAELGAPALVDRPLYRFPFLGALAVGVSAVALGLARRALTELVDLAGRKTPQGSAKALAERPVVQLHTSEAEAAQASARALLDQAISDAWNAAASGPVGDDHRRRLRLAATNATQQSVKAVDLCYHAGGGSSVYRTSPLQRVFRDVHVASQHAMVSPRIYEVLGRATLGLPTDLRQL